MMKAPPDAFDARGAPGSTFLPLLLLRGGFSPGNAGEGARAAKPCVESPGLERSSTKQNPEWIWGSEAAMPGRWRPVP